MTDSDKKIYQAKVMAELKELLKNMLIFLESQRDHPPSEDEQQKLLKALQEMKGFKLDDRRRHPRKSCRIPITVGVFRVFSEIVNNISNGGLFIDTSSSFSPGEILSLILSPPNGKRPVKISGKVVRKTPEGVGVQFTAAQSEELRKMIESL